MSEFRDTKQRTWRVDFRVDHLPALRDVLGCQQPQKLTSDVAVSGVLSLSGDPESIVKLTWRVIEDQATERGVSPEDFAKALNADSLDSAYRCLIEEVSCFFPRAGREAIRAAIPAMFQKADQEARQQVARALNSLRGNGLEQSE